MPSGDNMEAQEMSSQEQEGLADKVMDSLGEPEQMEHESESHGTDGTANSNEGVDHAKALASAKKRLKAQSMSHARDVQGLHARIADLEQKLSPNSPQSQETNPYASHAQPGSVEEHIHKAVSFALNHRDQEERKAREMQNQAHVQKQYKELYKHLDNMGDKYDDFHDVVMGDDAQFTPAMRDYALTMPKTGPGSVGEVLYKLGKDPEALERIAKLHPLDQAAEMARLSHALVSGGEAKGSQPRPLGQIKSNPVTNSHVITDKTPVSSIRQRMKSGSWK
jgi:hypothetical protein